tara:strand:+ start:315 stop:497 length:183 start_codon:yes stop_codon:yes gene_type:complete
MSKKITQGDVADLLGSSNDFDEIDYSIHDSPTKGCVAVVYFYECTNREFEDAVVEAVSAI